jgi:hypothetical protein
MGAEGGDDALAMLPHLYGLPTPPVWRITTCAQFDAKIDLICANHRQMDINTVIVDSTTFLADMWMTELIINRLKQPKIQAKVEKEGGSTTSMAQRDWGLLAMYLKTKVNQLHSTPLNVIWTALDKENRENNEAQGISWVRSIDPAIKGEMSTKLPAMCKMIIYAQKETRADLQNPGKMLTYPVFHTSPTSLANLPRHKYGDMFPEGKLVDPQYGEVPTYNAIASRIGNFIYRT